MDNHLCTLCRVCSQPPGAIQVWGRGPSLGNPDPKDPVVCLPWRVKLEPYIGPSVMDRWFRVTLYLWPLLLKWAVCNVLSQQKLFKLDAETYPLRTSLQDGLRPVCCKLLPDMFTLYSAPYSMSTPRGFPLPVSMVEIKWNVAMAKAQAHTTFNLKVVILPSHQSRTWFKHRSLHQIVVLFRACNKQPTW